VCDRSRDHAASVFSAQNNVSVRWRRRRLGHRLRQQLPGADAAAATFGPSSGGCTHPSCHAAKAKVFRQFRRPARPRASACCCGLQLPLDARRKTKSTFTVIRSAERAAQRLPPSDYRTRFCSHGMESALAANGRRRFSPLAMWLYWAL
jgi:hypothetical protein